MNGDMSALESEIQWFLARDGKQYGPISDAEMNKLVELRHLRVADLVWCADFTDWRPAGSVFPAINAPAERSSPPATSPPQPSAPPAQREQTSSGSTPERATASVAPSAQAGTSAQLSDGQRPAAQTASQVAPTRARNVPGSDRTAGAASAPTSSNPISRSAPGQSSGATNRSGPNRDFGAAPSFGPFAGAPGAPMNTRPGYSSHVTSAPSKPKSNGGRIVLVSVSFLSLIAGGTWAAITYKDQLQRLTQSAASVTSTSPTAPSRSQEATPDVSEQTALAVPAPEPATPPSPATTTTTQASLATTASDPTAPATLDAELQARPLWVALKQQFPEWYEARLDEANRLVAEGKPRSDVTRLLVEALVTLRRENAQAALAASSEAQKALAVAFLDNLNALSAESGEDCYEFISKGEKSTAIVTRMQTPERSGTIEKQVLAVLSAITEGKKAPVAHAPPAKADYDVLASELTRIGWTQADMQLFADPKALAKAPHDRVCSMLRDWFTAHLAIPDAPTQQRLLFESLKPVISG